MTNANSKRNFGVLISAIVIFLGQFSAHADSTTPRLAAFYDLKMLLCGQTAYQWRGNDSPKPVESDVAQVGVGRDASYVLTTSGRVLTWSNPSKEKLEVLDRVTWFVAGRTGLFAVRTDGSLWHLTRPERWFREGDIAPPLKVATSVMTASIGDSADYFVTRSGILCVKGLAHRGQYGDGKLKPSNTFVAVAENVVSIKAHTGHAILLKKDGAVMGTGGNIYGPLGRHGIGDKAIVWGEIFNEAVAIATGSSHSLAMRRNGSLWHWGRDIGLVPKKVLDNVIAAAADQSSSIALLVDNSLWQWERGEQPELHFRCP